MLQRLVQFGDLPVTSVGSPAELGPMPIARQDVSLHEIDGEALIFDPTTGDTHHMNETALLVWRCCDGRGTAGEIADALADRFEIERSEARQHVDRIVGEFAARRLVFIEQRLDEAP
jgi:PqqD family protein of HPr-rel-A system